MRIRPAAAALLILTTTGWADQKLDETIAKAEEQLRKGRQEEAVKTIRKLVDQDGTGSEAQLVLSRLQKWLGDLDAAGQALDVAVATATGEQKAKALAARSAFDLEVAAGRTALAHAEQATNLVADATTLSARARAKVRVGDYPGAKADAEEALRNDPRSVAGRIALGEALLGLGRPADGVDVLQEAAATASRSGCLLCADNVTTLARTRLALALIGAGRALEAVAVARQASTDDPHSAEAFAVLGTAILAENKAHWNDAIAQAQMGTFNNPKDPLVHVMVARLFEAGSNPQQADRHYRMALETDPAYAPARVALLQMLIAGGQLDEAEAQAQKLIQDTPQSGDAHLVLGTILVRQGQFVEAIPVLEKAVQYSPGTALGHALLGLAAQRAGRYPQAAKAYRQAVKLDPKNLAYQETFGLVLGQAGQHQEGAEVLRRLTSTPGYDRSAGFTNLGWVYRNMNPRQPTQSAAAYRRALELDPKNTQAALGMGWANVYAEDCDQAIAAFTRAMKIDVKVSGEAYYGIARCYYSKEDMNRAEAAARKAQAAGRNVSALLEGIAKYRAAVKQNEEDRARLIAEAKAWERAQALVRQLQDEKDTQLRVDATRALAGIPASYSVQPLTWALQEEDREVRLAACQSLARLGPAAATALPMLKHLTLPPPEPEVFAPPEEHQRHWFDTQIQHCAQEAVKKIER
jgi:tetratricopeptide (TPR) repeat protein